VLYVIQALVTFYSIKSPQSLCSRDHLADITFSSMAQPFCVFLFFLSLLKNVHFLSSSHSVV